MPKRHPSTVSYIYYYVGKNTPLTIGEKPTVLIARSRHRFQLQLINTCLQTADKTKAESSRLIQQMTVMHTVTCKTPYWTSVRNSQRINPAESHREMLEIIGGRSTPAEHGDGMDMDIFNRELLDQLLLAAHPRLQRLDCSVPTSALPTISSSTSVPARAGDDGSTKSTQH
jgi:hypothetical protein